MMARWLLAAAALAALAGSGCCCYGPQAGCNSCGPFAGGVCCLCLPKPIIWCGNCNECGARPGEDCACPTDCGLLPGLRRCLSCGKGCGEIYVGEWLSDPPDCCDPCDQCYGQWIGPHGYCHLGPMQRLLAAVHGYKYCPKPCCNEGCGGCTKVACHSCGGAGCATCGGGHELALPGHGGEHYHSAPHGQSILNENWDRAPGAKPTPGKPIHKAQELSPHKVGRADVQTQPAMRPTYGRMVRTAGYWGR
jgi:hypothetical protein